MKFTLHWGGGCDDHDLLTIWPTSGCHGQMVQKIAVVKWLKLIIFDHDNGQNLKLTVVKWSKLVNFDH